MSLPSRPVPRASTPYEAAMWASLGLFYVSATVTAAAVLFAWGWSAFGGLLLLTFWLAVGVKFCQEMHESNIVERGRRQMVTAPDDGDGWG